MRSIARCETQAALLEAMQERYRHQARDYPLGDVHRQGNKTCTSLASQRTRKGAAAREKRYGARKMKEERGRPQTPHPPPPKRQQQNRKKRTPLPERRRRGARSWLLIIANRGPLVGMHALLDARTCGRRVPSSTATLAREEISVCGGAWCAQRASIRDLGGGPHARGRYGWCGRETIAELEGREVVLHEDVQMEFVLPAYSVVMEPGPRSRAWVPTDAVERGVRASPSRIDLVFSSTFLRFSKAGRSP